MEFQYALKYNGITQGFKKSGADKHIGIDEGWSLLHGGKNVPVYANGNGIIYDIQDQWEGGNVIIIKHDGFFTDYGHLSKVLVKKGQKITRGQQIGNMGDTGYYKDEKGKWKRVPPHLHNGLYKGDTFSYAVNNWVNPIDYFELYPGQSFAPKTIKKYGDKLKYHTDAPTKGIYKCLYDMNIRKSPNGVRVKVKDCTNAMKKALVTTNPNDFAVVKKGTKVTALGIVAKGDTYWLKNYSGYICIKDSKNEYCTKV